MLRSQTNKGPSGGVHCVPADKHGALPKDSASSKAGCESSRTYPYPRGLAGPEIADFGGLSGSLLPQHPLEKVGGEAPHLFQWVLRQEGAMWIPKIGDVRPQARNRG